MIVVELGTPGAAPTAATSTGKSARNPSAPSEIPDALAKDWRNGPEAPLSN